MIKSPFFKISFISTMIVLLTVLSFLVTDFNTKSTNFKNSPSILKIQNVECNHYDLELVGRKFEINPIKININKKYRPIVRTLVPKKLKIIESILCYSCATINDLINQQKNSDYLNNIK